jgi:hypothetical protein
MSTPDMITLANYFWDRFAIRTYDKARLREFAQDLIDSGERLTFEVRDAAARAIRW